MILPLIFLPFFNLIYLINARRSNYTLISFIFVLLNLIYTLILFFLFDLNSSNFQFKFYFFNKLIFGIDGISLFFILIINIIFIILLLNRINQPNKYLIKLLISIQLLSLLIFLVLDLFLFYLSFETILLPMFLLIFFYGSRNKKIEGSILLIIYTILGSLFLLLILILLILQTGTTDYEILLTLIIHPNQQYFLWFGFFIAFAIKMPLFPFHIWLPQAHTEASTEGSVILAGILLKLGIYGIFRFILPLFPDASLFFSPFISIFAILGVLYSSLSAFSLIDFKQIIAYSSIAHMNLSIIGIFSNDLNGLIGSFLYSISHSFISTGLFLLVGYLYSRYHSRSLKYYRGLILFMPLYILFLFFFLLTNLSFPGSLGFLAEIFLFLSISPLILIIISLISIFLPLYLFWTFQKISYGNLSLHFYILTSDLTFLEFNSLFLLLFFLFFFGLFPQYILPYLTYSLFLLLI